MLTIRSAIFCVYFRFSLMSIAGLPVSHDLFPTGPTSTKTPPNPFNSAYVTYLQPRNVSDIDATTFAMGTACQFSFSHSKQMSPAVDS